MLTIYIAALSLILAAVLVNQWIQLRRHRRRLLWAVEWVRQLRKLLELFPKHRGMANALLNGDKSFRPAMQQLQAELDNQLLALRRMGESRDGSIEPLLLPIERQWQVIRNGVFGMSAKQSFGLHTQLISQVIERMQDDSLDLQLHVPTGSPLSSMLAMLTRELPHVVESIGQARGVGTGVAARQSSTVANRVDLKFLHGKISTIINERLIPARSAARHFQGIESVIDNTVASTQNFLTLLQRELIDNRAPNMSPETFYQQGTAAIAAGFELFDQLFPRCLQSMDLKHTAV